MTKFKEFILNLLVGAFVTSGLVVLIISLIVLAQVPGFGWVPILIPGVPICWGLGMVIRQEISNGL